MSGTGDTEQKRYEDISDSDEEVNKARAAAHATKQEYVDVLGNGTLMKKILEVGNPNKGPKFGEKVSVNMTREIPDLQKVLPDEQLQFVLGDGDVVQALDLVLPIMKMGEMCEVLVDYKYMYGERGLLPYIPPRSNFKLTVELLASKPLDYKKLDFDERFAEANIKKERGNFHFLREDYRLALNSFKKAGHIIDHCDICIESAEEVQKILDFSAIIKCNISATQYKLDDYEAALGTAVEVTTMMPSSSKGYIRLAQAQEKVQEIEGAMKSFQLALQYNTSSNEKWLHEEIERLSHMNEKNKRKALNEKNINKHSQMYSKRFTVNNPPSKEKFGARPKTKPPDKPVDDLSDSGSDEDEWKMAKSLVKPKKDLSEQELNEQLIRILGGSNPVSPKCSFKGRQKKQTSFIDQLAAQSGLTPNIFHKNFNKNKRWCARLPTLHEGESYPELAASESGEAMSKFAGAKGEKPKEKLTDLSFPALAQTEESGRKSTYEFHFIHRGTQTEPDLYKLKDESVPVLASASAPALEQAGKGRRKMGRPFNFIEQLKEFPILNLEQTEQKGRKITYGFNYIHRATQTDIISYKDKGTMYDAGTNVDSGEKEWTATCPCYMADANCPNAERKEKFQEIFMGQKVITYTSHSGLMYDAGTDVDYGYTDWTGTPPNYRADEFVVRCPDIEELQPKKKSSSSWWTKVAATVGAGLAGLAGFGIYKYFKH